MVDKFTKKELKDAKELSLKMNLSWEPNVPILAMAIRKARAEERERGVRR